MKKGIAGLLIAMLCASIVGAVERPGTLISTMKTAGVVNQDQILKSVEKYVADIQREKGSFVLKDAVTGQTLTLTQDKLRTDDAAMLKENEYLLPGVFKTADGKSVEIDFVLTHAMMGLGKELKVSDAYIRSVDGVDRYQWLQEKNEWKRETINKM